MAAALAAGAPGPSNAARLVVDPFLEPFPPHPELPRTGYPILFHGRFCDGRCPPGEWVSHPYGDQVIQPDVASVPGGNRAAVLFRTSGTSPAQAIIEDGRLRVTAEAGDSLRMAIGWGVWRSLEFDVPAAGCDRLEFGVRVLATPVSGVTIRAVILFRSRLGESRFTLPLTTGGELSWSLAQFPGVDFTRLDAIVLELLLENDHQVDYEILPLVFRSSDVPAARASWGGVRRTWR